MKKKTNKLFTHIIIGIVFYIALIGIWQLIYVIGVEKLEIWKSYAFPSPVGVWETLQYYLDRNKLFPAIQYSLATGACGYAVSVVFGFIVGFFFAFCPKIAGLLRPLFMGVQSLPSVCWVPFAILWFGLEKSAILFVVIMGSAFGIALAVESAIDNINPIYVKAAKTMGAKKHQMFFQVVLPAAMPQLISGLRQGWSFAWRALMSGEVMANGVGLGQALINGRSNADINEVMLIIVVIIVVGIIIDKCIFRVLENKAKYQ